MTARLTWGKSRTTLEDGSVIEGSATLDNGRLRVRVRETVVLDRAVSSAKRQGGGKEWTLTTDEGQVRVRKLGCCG